VSEFSLASLAFNQGEVMISPRIVCEEFKNVLTVLLIIALSSACDSSSGGGGPPPLPVTAGVPIPTLATIVPATGPLAGGTTVTFTGTGFQVNNPGTITITVGATPATSIVVVSDTTITAVTPAGTAGAADIIVSNTNGSVTLTNGFTYNLVPTLSTIAPAMGAIAGGDSVTLTGTGFQANNAGTNTVTIGTNPATSVVVVSDTSITAVTPAAAAGAANVTVSNSNGSVTLTNGFTYGNPLPTLSTIAPALGVLAGGDSVTLTGTGFQANNAGTNTVTIGTNPATSVVVVSDTSITAVTPAGAASGATNVTVSNNNGSDTLTNGFSYNPLPTLSTIAPAMGALAGGDSVTLTGTGFQANNPGVNTVTIGANPATSVVVVSDTSITAVTPAGAAGGAANVTVSNTNGSVTLTNGFTYNNNPGVTLSTIAPAMGALAGGDSVTLTGTGFQANNPGTNTVTIGANPATSVVVVSDTSITAVTPAGAASGATNVTVSNNNGSDTLTNGFSYNSVITFTAISPTIGTFKGGTPITLTGSGFQANNPGTNTVTVGANPATSVVVVSDTSITAITPAGPSGTVNVTVSNNNGSVTLNNAFRYKDLFGPAVNFDITSNTINVGTSPVSVATGDFNKDGNPDLITANLSSDNVSVLLGIGDGTFGTSTNLSFSITTQPIAVAIRDFNGDGNPDIATVLSLNSDAVAVLLGNGDGTFGAASNFATGTNPNSLALGDFNGDGKPDLATAENGTVSVLLGNGNGGFAAPITTTAPAGTNPISVIAEDFNGDGKTDLATANGTTDNVSLFIGLGTGSFAASPAVFGLGAGTGPQSVKTGDFDGDGDLDLATANRDSNDVSVLLGDGMGSFAAATNFGIGGGTGPLSVVVADFDKDGKSDLATSNGTTDNVSVLLGDGMGSFGAAAIFDLNGGMTPRSMVAGDFNRDGQLDLATANQDSDNVSVLLNLTAPTPGNYGPVQRFNPNGGSAFALTTGDINADGNPDIITVNDGSNNISVLMGDGMGSFAIGTTFGIGGGTGPRSVVIGDFNKDGKADVATANNGTANISVLLGNGSGGFATTSLFGLNGSTGPFALVTGDFNKDGNPDLATSNGTNDVAVLLGDGTGNFASATLFGLNGGAAPNSLVVGDLNRDGNPDLITANGSNDVAVLLGDGSGSFGTATLVSLNGGTSPLLVVVADFNKDGKPDLATANNASDNVSVLIGNGMGSFDVASNIGLNGGDGPRSVVVGDFNGDGNSDLATANGFSGNVSVLLGNGMGGFATATPFSISPFFGPQSVTTGDFNKDGILDIATSNGANDVFVLFGS
jgi:hypothetical protein